MSKKSEVRQMEIFADDIKISITGESDNFWLQDLHTRSVQTLIENADIHAWVKHNDDFEALDNFSSSVFSALARLYARENDVFISGEFESGVSVGTVLGWMLAEFKNNPAMTEVLTKDSIYID